MLTPVTVITTILAALWPCSVTAQAAGDSATLLGRVEAYQERWNAHDPSGLASFFSEDADLVLGHLPSIRGRGAIEAWWRRYFEGIEPERQGTFEMLSVRLMTPQVAVVDVASTTGDTGEGAALPVMKARATWLLELHPDGEWLIAVMRGLPTETDRVELRPSLETAESLRPQIRAVVAAYEDAFNRHDPDALSAFYRDDADIIIREGPATRGAEAIRRWWRAYFSQPRPYRALMIIEEIRMLADDVAVLNIIATGAPMEATGELVPTRHARATWVLVREGGEWRISALRVLPSEDDEVVREPGV